MIKHSFPIIVLFFSLSGCHPPDHKQETLKPNILFIAIDDLRPELGAYGNPVVKTPHLDNLASQGRLFTRHYVQVPTCGASRYSMLSGRRPFKPSHLSNQAIVTEMSEHPGKHDPESFAHQLKKHGYYTAALGKIGHYTDGRVYAYEAQPSDTLEMPNSWDEITGVSGEWGTAWNAFFGFAHGRSRTVEKRQVLPYEAADVPDEGYPDGITAQMAVDKLKELAAQEQPFLLAVGFYKPHLPFAAPKKYWDLYDTADISISPNPEVPLNSSTESLQSMGEINGYQLSPEKAGPGIRLSDGYSKTLIHGYYAAMSYADAQVGKVLKALEETGKAGNTIVVVWGDHGWHLGDHTVWGKHTVFERALRSAFIVRTPGIKQPGVAANGIVESLDIYPTLMELTGTPAPDSLDGVSLVPVLEDPHQKTRQAAYGYFRRGISMISEDYRLTVYKRKSGTEYELYDRQNDPWETRNIAEEKPALVEQLLEEWKKGDTGLFE